MKKTKISIGILIIFVCGIIVGKFFVDQDGQSLPILSTANAQNSPTKALALNYMVWNVTKDKIKVRMGAKDEEVWPSPALKKKIAPKPTGVSPFSEFILSGREPFPEVVQPIYDDVNKKYGTDFKAGN